MAEHTLAPLDAESYRKIWEEGILKCRSNTIPESSSDQLLLHSLVNTARRVLQKCTDEIITLQLLQYQLTNTSVYQETLLSPVRKLPSEIMISIFILATADKKGVIYLDSPDDDSDSDVENNDICFQCTRDIFLLTWVCHRWRQIILFDPSFWNSYHIREQCGCSPDIEIPMVTCLNELLLRSGTVAPLSLHLHSGYDRMHPVLDAVVEHTSRWKEVKLEFWDIPRTTFKDIHAQIMRFPNLEVLNISIVGPYVLELGSLGEVFGDCPRLHYLEITSFHPREVFDLQYLTTLKIGSCIGPSFALLLRRCPVLKTLWLSCPKPDSIPESPVTTIHHLHLKDLTVNHLDYRSSMTFWRNVSLPNLTRVHANIFYGNEDQSPFDEFKQMLVDSQCVLEQFDLLWRYDHPRNSIESLVEGIRLSPQSHTHCVPTKSDPYLIFKVAPANKNPRSYREEDFRD